jgi:hypothetical protein
MPGFHSLKFRFPNLTIHKLFSNSTTVFIDRNLDGTIAVPPDVAMHWAFRLGSSSED